jgi:hypothetical protein
MSEENRQETQFDRKVSGLLASFGQQSPRRGFIALLSKFILTTLGISFVPLMPLDRSVKAQQYCPECGALELCGINGRLCTACPNGSCYNCPDGTSLGGYWSKCCGAFEYAYYDCCVSPPRPACCTEGPRCPNDPSVTSTWCYGQSYCCTIVVQTGYPCPI